MSALAWWLIPVVATLIAFAWIRWRNRTRPPADAHQAMADMARFKEAMERPNPARSHLGIAASGDADRAGTDGATAQRGMGEDEPSARGTSEPAQHVESTSEKRDPSGPREDRR